MYAPKSHFSTWPERIWLISLSIPFSYIGSIYVLNVNGNFYPELFLFPWLLLFYYSEKQRQIFLHSIFFNIKFISMFFILTSVAMIGLLRPEADVVQFYARYRAFICFFVAIHMGYKMQKSENYEVYLTAILWISASASLLFLLNSVLDASGIAKNAQSAVKSPISIFSYIITLTILLNRKRNNLAVLFLFLLIFNSSISFFRQNYIFAILSSIYFILAYVIISKNENHKKKKYKNLFNNIMLIILLLLLSYFFVSTFMLEFLSSTNSRYAQSIGKITEMLSLGERGMYDSSSLTRIQEYKYLFNNIEYFFLPNGIVNTSNYKYYSIWGGDYFNSYRVDILRDSMIIYFVSLFGLFLLIPISFYKLLQFFYYVLVTPSLELRLRATFFFLIFGIVIFLDGGSINQFEKAFFTGTGLTMAFPLVQVRNRHLSGGKALVA